MLAKKQTVIIRRRLRWIMSEILRDMATDMIRDILKYKKRYQVRPFLLQRKCRGDFYVAVPEMIRDDPAYFFETFRVTPCVFEDLLLIVGPHLEKNTFGREPISPAQRLMITLAYLASGDAQKSIAKDYRVGRSTVSNVVHHTCNAIYENLKSRTLPPPSEDLWNRRMAEFERKWQFPHCVGALDGKHFAITAPPNSSSVYYNYKGFFSVVLLGLCDANYNFTYVNVGAVGSESDGGIFKRSLLGKKIINEDLELPPLSQLPGSSKIAGPVFIGDEAFPLLCNLLRPYPGDNLTMDQRIFNYRLSRARRIIENTFGILVARWRIFTNTMNLSEQNAKKAILACVCLHNYVRSQQETNLLYTPPGFVDNYEPMTQRILPGSWRTSINYNNKTQLSHQGSNNCSSRAKIVRNLFKEYFMNEGAVPWQSERLRDY